MSCATNPRARAWLAIYRCLSAGGKEKPDREICMVKRHEQRDNMYLHIYIICKRKMSLDSASGSIREMDQSWGRRQARGMRRIRDR